MIRPVSIPCRWDGRATTATLEELPDGRLRLSCSEAWGPAWIVFESAQAEGVLALASALIRWGTRARAAPGDAAPPCAERG